MNILGNRIKKLRSEMKLNQTEFSNALNSKFNLKTDRVMVSKWETGFQTPVMSTVVCIAQFFNVSIDYLNGNDTETYSTYENIIPFPNTKTVPLLGTIACGEPILAVENIEGDVAMPEHVHADFALKAKGDSMTDARINDGDIVYIRMQPIVQNGEIAAVLIDNEATLKRFYQKGDTVTLMPCNNKYAPFTYTGEELNDIRILGKAVGFTSTDI